MILQVKIVYCGGNLVIDMSGTVLNLKQNTTVVAGATLTGELVDTSDKKKKYDIKAVEHNMTDIVKAIEPKTFKMIDEKKIGITKNHIGFVADDLINEIPSEWENIVLENDEGIKQLNYIKMNAILWGAVREQQQKIEHLESSVYELQEAMKELVKPKPNPRQKQNLKFNKYNIMYIWVRNSPQLKIIVWKKSIV